MVRSLCLLALVGMVAGCSSVREAMRTDRNPAPCPAAFALYDASRKVDFVDGQERFASVGFTAEIEGVRSLCFYDGEGGPILANLEIDMSFGRGPMAEGQRHQYPFFVAVTRKNLTVIDKQVFNADVRFARGETRVMQTETLREIRIPRAAESVAGSNFEILVGFELDEAELEFNRAGKRFLVDSGT